MKPRRRPPPPPVHVYARQEGARVLYCLSLLAPADLIAAGGLHRAAILGTSSDPQSLSTETFLPNPLFLELLYDVVAAIVPEMHVYARRAWFLRSGELAVWDGRSRDRTIPDAQQDVLGKVRVDGGRVLPESFTPNPDYSPLSDRGLMRLPSAIQAALVARLRELRVPLFRAPGEH